jgi:hypothetical protein
MALFGIPCPALLVLRVKRSVDRLTSPFSDVGTKVTHKWSWVLIRLTRSAFLFFGLVASASIRNSGSDVGGY